MQFDINEIISSISEANNSVDNLMALVDSGLLNRESIWLLADKWDEVTLIPFEYAQYLAEDNLELLVRTVVNDYNSAFEHGNYVWAMFLHKSNKWMSQIIGASKYRTLDEIFNRYEERLLEGDNIELFEGVSSYNELIEKSLADRKDVNSIIQSIEEARSTGDFEKMYSLICEGLADNPCNYKLYINLGEYYLENESALDIDKAYLCLENALLYCDNDGECAEIRAILDCTKESVAVRKTAIIIVSYNLNYMLQKNIERIRESILPGTYQIVVVDNASDDGVYEWLKEQEDILLLGNEENVGFGIACNQGVELLNATTDEEYDIFLLNNDTRLADNALFWLRMGLYEDREIGATGSLSNYAGNEQQLDIDFATPGDYLEYGKKNNIPMANPYEERVRLSGFAMLIKSGLWKEVGGMDPIFSPGYFEDDDLSMKIREKGYKLILCRNSFIYHAGSQSFGKVAGINELLQNNYLKFIDKYGLAINDYAYPVRQLADSIIGAHSGDKLLFYGSGLGADMAYMASVYPELVIWGIEDNEKLRMHSCLPANVLKNIGELGKTADDCKFDYIFINKKNTDDVEEIVSNLEGYIKTGTSLITYSSGNSADVHVDYCGFNKIKLIIWDLDDTFWKGTISEERVTPIPENVELIKTLADCGIVNSISSKNDREVAIERLADMGVADYFVFASINWEGKGNQIADKLTAMRLRPENTLFIDDNVANLNEASFFAKGIMTAGPDIIPKLIAYFTEVEPTDKEHKRLIQYRVLEEKQKKEESFASRDEFLRFSNIKVDIHEDCGRELDRIAEMVMRTNQLNYTKLRSDKASLTALIADVNCKCGYVTAKDKFGDYGIVGFYALDSAKKELIHFLFSCRVMGMGVEQFVYNYLGQPALTIAGEVAVEIENNKETPWINLQDTDDLATEKTKPSVDGQGGLLLKGPCDLATMEAFIDYPNISSEFNYVNDKGVITAGQNHSVHIIESMEMTEEEIQSLLVSAQIVCRGDFETDIFKPGFDFICYSLLPDCHTGLYRNKKSGAFIAFGSKNYDITNPEYWNDLCFGKIVNHSYPFNKQMLLVFEEEWEFVGCTPVEMLIDNLTIIYSKLPDTCKLILLLGSEIESEEKNGEFDNHAPWHAIVNRAVEKFAADKERIVLINPTKYIHSQDDFAGCTNHYSRNVYYSLSQEINEIIK